MRLHNWGQANLTPVRIEIKRGKVNLTAVRLVTEYGCVERGQYDHAWDHYGKRVPSFTHFANWSSLVLGHAGLPFKWNDGKTFGEMEGRRSAGRENTDDSVWKESSVWKASKYPPDNYAEIRNIRNFLRNVTLDDLYSQVLEIVDEFDNPVAYLGSDGKQIIDQKSHAPIARFNAWALTNPTRTNVLAWIYDRTFSTNGKQIRQNGIPITCCIKVSETIANHSYDYAWFDTWAGDFISTGQGTIRSDAKGALRISLPKFPMSIKFTVPHATTARNDGADGNDIAIRLIAAT